MSILIRPIIRPLLQPIGEEPAWSPVELFTTEQGAFYDISAMSSLFQDDAGATSVTATGQTVGRVLDLSGNGNHLTQSDSGKAPVYQSGSGRSWLVSGVNTVIASSIFNWGSDSVTAVFGVRLEEWRGWLFTFGQNPGTNQRSFGVLASFSLSTWVFRSNGTVISAQAQSAAIGPENNLLVTGVGKISDPLCSLQLNNLTPVVSTANQGSENYATNQPIRLFNRVTDGTVNGYVGNLYAAIIINRILTESELAAAKSWVSSRVPA